MTARQTDLNQLKPFFTVSTSTVEKLADLFMKHTAVNIEEESKQESSLLYLALHTLI